jgi:hypothetical protein
MGDPCPTQDGSEEMRQRRGKMTEEYRTIIDWCLVVLDFLARRTPGEHRSIYQSGEKDLVETFERGGLRGLKMAYRETLVMAKQLPPADQVKLDELLRRKFGSGLDEVFAESDRKADEIIKRGKIKDEDEFYFLREYFESIWEDDKQRERAALIDEMLAEFEKREE